LAALGAFSLLASAVALGASRHYTLHDEAIVECRDGSGPNPGVVSVAGDDGRKMRIADQEAARRDVQVATGAVKPPGAWVHVLTIGINDYDDKAKDLHLDFASKDASDVFNALVNTQDSRFNKLGGLHAEVLARALPDELATASTQAKTNSSIGTFLT
jgi:hypothetical protein